MPVTRDRVRWGAFVAAVTVNVLVLYWPRPVSGAALFPGVDKVVHVGIFAAVALAGILLRLPPRWLVGLLVLHGVSSELVQHWALPARSGDPLDAVADMVGVGIGAALGVAAAGGARSWVHGRGGRDRADRVAADRDTGAA